MKYDDPNFHLDNDFPDDAPEDNAVTHMGFFFAWALSRGLISDFHREEEDSAVLLRQFGERKMSPRDYVIQFCDSQFTNEDFSDVGNAFVEHYYMQHYFGDFSNEFEASVESIYHVDDSWENADKMVPVLDKRFEDWNRRRDRRHWWKFW